MTVPCVERQPPVCPLIPTSILNRKWRTESFPLSSIFQTAIVLVAGQFPDQREQRQVHGNDHAADDRSQEHDHDGFEGGQEVLHRRIHFVLVEIRNLLQHGIHRAGLFTHGDHLRNHAGENRRVLQWLRKRLAFFKRSADLKQRPFHYRVARRLRRNVQPFQNRHTGRNQGAQRPCESRHRNLAHQDSQNRQLQNDGIHDEASLRSSVPHFESEDASGDAYHDQQAKDAAHEVAQPDDDLRWQRQVHAQSGEEGRENRYHLPQQKGDDAARNGYDADWVNQRRFDGCLQLHVFLDVRRKALQNGVKNTARFASFHHVAIKRVKYFRILLHRRRQVASAFDRGTRARQHLLKQFVLLLAGQNFQALHQRKPGVNHHRELAGEHREFLGGDSAAKCRQVELFALFRHLRRRDLLAPQQTLQLRLAGSCHFPGDRPTRPIRSSISKDRHNLSSSTDKSFVLPSPENHPLMFCAYCIAP